MLSDPDVLMFSLLVCKIRIYTMLGSQGSTICADRVLDRQPSIYKRFQPFTAIYGLVILL